MTKRKTRKSSSSKRKRSQKRTRSNPLFTLVLLIGLLALGGYYFLTGSDPLGIFGRLEENIEETDLRNAIENTLEETIDETLFQPDNSSEFSPPELVGSGGDWWQVYFTDPQNVNNPDDFTNTIPQKFIDHIHSAQQSIQIAAFEFNLTPIAQALIEARQRGVEIQWITDDEHGIEADEEEGHGQFSMLERAGIEIRDDNRSALMHNKFAIFDNQTVWTGSTNLTINGNFRNNNNVIILDSPEVATIYEREFEELWAGESGPTSPSTIAQQSTIIDGTPIHVLFAAEDEVIEELVLLVKSARESVRFMAFSFTHDELGQAMLDQASAGVDIQGIFETRGSETEFSELTRLFCAGLPIRQDGNPGTFHHKVIIVDDQTLVTGSLNFSNNADESNDENVVIITNRDIANQYLEELERRWSEATEPSTSAIQC